MQTATGFEKEFIKDDTVIIPLKKEFVKMNEYFNKIAQARLQLIEAVKDDVKVYQQRLVDTMIDCDCPVLLVDLSKFEDLYTVKVPEEAFNNVTDYELKHNWNNYYKKYVVVDGITIISADNICISDREEETA